MKRRGFFFLAAMAGLLAVTALAGPVWERLPQPVVRDDAALIVVLDLSLSMDAVDIKPNRLVQARFKLNDLLTRREYGQTGLVVYARNAFTIVPVTDDSAALELYLQSLNTKLMPNQGSRADLGLQEAFSLLQRVKAESGDVLLVTDYADARVSAQARKLHDSGYAVSVMGIGTKAGGPVFLSSGDFLSHNGEVVVPQFEDTGLKEVVQAGGGVYARFDSFGDSDVQTLLEWFEMSESSSENKRRREATADKWREEGPWLLLLLLPIALLGFRRGALVVVGCVVLMRPGLVYALDWDSLWLRPDQQAARVLEKNDHSRAAELFEDREWEAVARHRGGDFAGAVETLEPLDGAPNWYNKGNSLVGEGKLQEAIEAYRHALEIDPQMEDASYNMGVVRKFLQQAQEQSAQQSDSNEEGGGEPNAQSFAGEDGEKQDDESSNDGDTQDVGEENPQTADAGNEDSGTQEDESQDGEETGDANEETDGTDEADGDSADDAFSEETLTETDQAIEQWLRSVNETPSRLLKRKLEYLSRKKKNFPNSKDKPW